MRASAVAAGAIAGTVLRPSMSVYAVAGRGFVLREAGIFNTTTTAARYALVRLTAAGTPGAAITEAKFGTDEQEAPVMTAFLGHTADATLGAFIAAMPIGAAIGAGTILTFYGEGNGIQVPAGTGNGVGIILLAGTGQVSDLYMIWDE
jgi:hypothetical protein